MKGTEAASGRPRMNLIARRGTKVDLRLHASGLTGQLAGFAPTSFAVVFLRNQQGSAQWAEISRSEPVPQSFEAKYPGIFHTDYKFELYQEIRVCIFDKMEPNDNLERQFLIGVADTSLGDLVAARGSSLTLELTKIGGGSSGTVSITAEEIMDAKKEISLEIGLKNLMTSTETREQNTYLEQLSSQLNIPSTVPPVQRRPTAAILNMLRKEEKKPAVRPAHIENISYQHEQHRAEVQKQIDAVQQAPPPFVPYLVIYRAPESALQEYDWNSPTIQWEEVYRSKDVMQYTDREESIRLAPITLSQMELNECNDNRYIKIAVMRNSASGTTEVGYYVTSVSALHRTSQPGQEMVLTLYPMGSLVVHGYEEKTMPSFLDILRESRLDMSLVVGIDFTQSNGPPEHPSSLHYQPPSGCPPKGPNPYEAAMQSVANLLSAYSSDRRIAAYGFGAKIPPSWTVSHCFSLTGDPRNPLCENVSGLIEQYRNVLPRIQTWGPTMFSELLMTIGGVVSRRHTASGKGNLAYTCVLIITDGVISDMDKTRAELIKLSRYPVSVIIIGVGSEDFSKMRTLDDGEGKPMLKRGSDVAARRFVQFVDYASFARENGQVDLSVLGEKVLGNIPDHGMCPMSYFVLPFRSCFLVC